MERLGYDPLWLDEGILSRELLSQQCRELQQPGADQNAEHYRVAALQAFLSARDSLSDREVDVILKLGALDPDAVLRPNFAHSLIRFPGLTADQFEKVAASWDDNAFCKLVSRCRWLRILSSEEVSEQQLERAVHEGDAHVHRAVLGRGDLTPRVMKALADKGANRAVRNQAEQMLRSQRSRPDRGT